MRVWERLDPVHLDALKEIGNIGAGHAASALAAMLGVKINMRVPQAGILPLPEIPTLVGGEEDPVACVEFTVRGEAPSKIFFLLTQESAFLLVDMLLSRAAGSTRELDDMGISVLTEVGNILTGSFLNAFSQFCNLTFMPSVPAFAYDMLAAVLSSAFLEGGYFSDHALIIETEFFSQDIRLQGHFFLIPESEALEKIFSSLGMGLK